MYKVDPRRMNEFGTSAELPNGGQVEVDETGHPVEGAAVPALPATAEAPPAADSNASADAASDPDGLDEAPGLPASPAAGEGDELRRRKKWALLFFSITYPQD